MGVGPSTTALPSVPAEASRSGGAIGCSAEATVAANRQRHRLIPL